MDDEGAQLSNPFSTGGGGPNFENQVQTAFVVLMLTGGVVPCLPPCRIAKIKLQGRHAGFKTDDCIVFTKDRGGTHRAKLLMQIKHVISITENDPAFGEAIRAAWQDFQNPEVFDSTRDVIALITGPLTASDIQNARPLLEWARHSETAKEFFDNVSLGKFSSPAKQRKLRAFRSQVKKANNGIDVSDDQLWRFLKSYHLIGYDLDVVAGGTLSLLHSHIGQFTTDNIDGLWALAAREVSGFNQNAGTLNHETISLGLKTAFSERRQEKIPSQFLKREERFKPELQADYFTGEYSDSLMVGSLLGAWNEKSLQDMVVVGQMVGGNDDDLKAWVESIRAVSLLPNPPVMQRDGKWKMVDRKDSWTAVGSRMFDEHIDRFRKVAVQVLRESDPQFDLEPQDRFAANIRGKVFKHSDILRDGLSTTLALLGGLPTALGSVTYGKAEATAVLAIREIFQDADWVRWASLNNQLPLLAEAAPDEFLDALENALNHDPCPFIEVYAQEGTMPMGHNFLTGLLWALETLAWHPDYLIRVVSMLGDLAAIDPGGKWINRPANSLGEILLPWHPQTTASLQKRKAAVSTLLQERSDIGWKLLLALLPDSHVTASGSRKPVIREFSPADWPESVPNQDYWDQIAGYSELAIEVARNEPSKLAELSKRLPDLPDSVVLSLLNLLTSDTVMGLPESERSPIWEILVNLAGNHEKHADAEWALPAETIITVNEVADLLAPQQLSLLYCPLFGGHDYQLYEGSNDYEQERLKLEDKRQKAVQEVLQAEGISGVLSLARKVDAPFKVGFALGHLDSDAVDADLLPAYLGTEDNTNRALVDGFMRSRFWKLGWNWVDQIMLQSWTAEHKVTFLTLLPIMPETGRRAERLLGDEQRTYWQRANVNGFIVKEGILEVVDKLLQFGRPRSALLCLDRVGYESTTLTPALAARVLTDVATVDEPSVSLDAHAALGLIKWLQDNPDANADALMKIEWAYLPLFNRSLGGAPKVLGHRMATDPSFFCEVIGTAFRPEKDRQTKLQPTETEKIKAQSAYSLLRGWKTVPGLNPDGSIDTVVFEKWLADVKQLTLESGHFDIAMSQIGEVLAYAPPDSGGLWIHCKIAEALNARDATSLRSGFTRELFNRRGAYWHSGGKAEQELAATYKKQAEALELNGFHRFGTAMRELAESYERDARRDASRDPRDL
jgi:hypothetical protein